MKKRVLAVGLAILTAAVILVSCVPPVPGTTRNNEVVVIGDSIFALTGQIEAELQRLSGEVYRSYPVSGAQMNGGIVTPIPTQYNQAKRGGPIRTIIMDGGGNDIQIGAAGVCTMGAVTQACKNALQPALRTADNLFAQMRADGVENIVYMNYFYIVAQASKPAFNWMSEQMDVVAAKYNAVIVDATPLMNDRLIGPDRIHPTTAGSQVLARAIWQEMQANGIEQNGGGGTPSPVPGCGF